MHLILQHAVFGFDQLTEILILHLELINILFHQFGGVSSTVFQLVEFKLALFQVFAILLIFEQQTIALCFFASQKVVKRFDLASELSIGKLHLIHLFSQSQVFLSDLLFVLIKGTFLNINFFDLIRNLVPFCLESKFSLLKKGIFSLVRLDSHLKQILKLLDGLLLLLDLVLKFECQLSALTGLSLVSGFHCLHVLFEICD